ncbi:response regulator transcription factor [Chitinophaga polysaccharea]|uniref:LytR/AlgR family response regulator transcription factor n=1 Tax=Chitinophaga TaxID=79328 RepID=UPI0014554922|nr:MULTISPECIES: LytTR family DNA-binding domain-containing protein [Chitinophaga]NLR58675.1 response regulator transcription factor [Chitinophaga polysaccharea]NLU91203.1 response regulator transcription factor [Chitinophaga sp. Ak27]
MALKCIVVDDEPLAAQVLVSFINKTPDLQLLKAFHHPLEALQFLKQEKVDVVFLDIQMQELSGIELMQLAPAGLQIVIVSAYDEYAVEGFDREAVDYLLKPVSFDRFARAVQRVLAKSTPAISQPAGTDYIFVRTDKRIVRVDLKDILFVEALRNYVAIQTSRQKILTLQNLRSFEEILAPFRFFRVHKSYIISLDKIDSIERQRIFTGPHSIPIGDAYLKQFLEVINMPR